MEKTYEKKRSKLNGGLLEFDNIGSFFQRLFGDTDAPGTNGIWNNNGSEGLLALTCRGYQLGMPIPVQIEAVPSAGNHSAMYVSNEQYWRMAA